MTTVSEAYTHWSPTYDTGTNRTRDLDADATRAELAGLRPRTVIEFGCGTGKNTVFFAQIADTVRAFDFSPGMLAQAQAKVTTPHVSFALADITAPWTSVETVSADLVTCNLVLEHIADLRHVFREAARVLVPGGSFFVCELHPFRQYTGTVANFVGADGEPVNVAAFVHHVSDFTDAAQDAGLSVAALREWWHDTDDRAGAPRLLSLRFVKPLV